MASEAHQFMLILLARKMKSLDFEPIAYDGDSYKIGTLKLKVPPTIHNHRPDIIGINIDNEFCVGEVKTENDIFSERTKQQLIDFSKKNKFIICTTSSAQEKLVQKLNRLGLLFNKNIEMLIVPDELIPDDEEII
ncbi:hypothetical protein HNV12_11795 [Methanococcoides sp. SA1]|nr:hypothetical protein [Methanococcoides sp. SA1]